ncbi:LysR family transcriptional regulator [Paenibacillus nasutitermitis]|uniref:HTH-type transcriptional regulator YybE n=1 Tax=Paenibacillus nasutitermitis TaxID=1652958 RepID=A0A917E0K6_9BACL|nr:LysR family transcriptional regulator [Paenibacillus nasutitermitis]GGD84923.1 putative HTH-type transcriptional regulator YybE [Paenibacillus nasutitermitis]
MELTQLEYFLTVARLQHVTRASEELSITQPALSHSISKLEAELGVPLFDRSGRNVQVNRYGRMFAERVERAMQEITKGKQEIEEWSDSTSGMVGMAYLNILGAEFVPVLIRGFHQLFPQIRFDLIQGNHLLISSQLEAGACDLIITSTIPESSAYEWIHMRTIPLYAVVPLTHRLADREAISLQDLSGEPYVNLKSNCGLNATVDACFYQIKFTPATAYEAEDLTTVAGFVAAGLGVSVLPKTNGLMLDGLAWLPIDDEGVLCEIGLVRKRERYLSPATKRFLDYARDKATN